MPKGTDLLNTSAKSRVGVAAASLALLVTGGLVQVAPAVAAPHRAAASCENDEGPDFDLHRKGSDVAIGVPGEDIGKVKDAGAVEVRYGCDSTLAPQGISLPHPQAGDGFRRIRGER